MDPSNIGNHIGDVMVSVLASSAVHLGFEPGWVKPKTIRLVFVAAPLNMQERAKTGWLEIRIMCLEWSDIRRLLFQ
jgi:hypothetical protein